MPKGIRKTIPTSCLSTFEQTRHGFGIFWFVFNISSLYEEGKFVFLIDFLFLIPKR